MNQVFQIKSGEPLVSLIEMSGVSKTFGSSIALDDVSLELFPGSVHALIGENGAGKSTLMKILAGVVQPDQGTVRLNGRELRITGPREALDAGISTVFQELSLLPNLTIAENMFLGREPTTRFGTVDIRLMERRAGSTLNELGLTLDPATLVSELTIADRQFVEIARGIFANASVVILDEPTAALNAADVETLNRHIRRLKEQGKAIVYISHRMDEIFAICDTVTVLKDGRKVATRPIREVTPQSLVAMMVGRQIEDLFPRRGTPGGQPVLAVEGLRLTSDGAPLSFTLCRGEIVALAGLEGQGQREVLRSLIGEHQPHGGTLTVKGRRIDLPISPSGGVRQMQATGVGFVPEDRKDEGLFLGLPLAHNISIGLHTARPELSLARRYQKIVTGALERLSVKATGPGAQANSLSGGNQQKVLLGRYLASGADILFIEEPTRGVDIGAKAEIYKLLRNFADDGGAILVLSRETIELIGLCDRILVVHGKAIVRDMPAGEATEHNILDAALIT